MKNTVEIQIGWLEGLLREKDRLPLDEFSPLEQYRFASLLGYVESARGLLPVEPNP